MSGTPIEDLVGGAAVVTGAGSGIGRSLALAWAAAGMKVVVADIEAEAAEAVAGEVENSGGEALAIACDVTDPAAVAELAVRSQERFGFVRMLCNNAGVLLDKPLLDCNLDDWRWVYAVNLFGVVHGIGAFLPGMRAQPGRSHIVNTASDAGVLNQLPSSHLDGGEQTGISWGVYQTSKHAVVSYSEQLANALAGTGVGVSVLCPSPVATRILDSERHRPVALGGSPGEAAPAEDLAMPATAITPERVADLTRDAVERGRLYVFTERTPAEALKQRCASIAGDVEFL